MRPSTPPRDLGLVLEFLRELWALDHAMQKRSKRMARELGVTGPLRLALLLISRFPGLPAGHLARLLHRHPSTVSGIVKQLAGRGLIARGGDGPDRRRAMLRITPLGLSLLSRPEPTLESAVHQALSQLTDRQIQAALRAIAVLAVSLASTAPRPASAP
jgi:MarR family transcriptional regulator, organic hydroperoxide resistance regulator